MLLNMLVLQTATFLAANYPSSVGDLYRYSSRRPLFSNSSANSPTSVSLSTAEPLPLRERVRIAALMRETGLKCAVFVGVPKVRIQTTVFGTSQYNLNPIASCYETLGSSRYT